MYTHSEINTLAHGHSADRGTGQCHSNSISVALAPCAILGMGLLEGHAPHAAVRNAARMLPIWPHNRCRPVGNLVAKLVFSARFFQ